MKALRGHSLWAIWTGGYRCECGALPPDLSWGRTRATRWHREHKADVIAALEPPLVTGVLGWCGGRGEHTSTPARESEGVDG